MIDSEEISQLLHKTKVNSLADVITFIFEHIHKVISLQPLQEISLRLTQLERPKGLDRVMIEEVKTLVQAIFEQKEDTMKKDIEKVVHHNLSINLQQQQHTRRSLNQLDFMQMLNVQQQNRKPSFGVEPKTQSIHRQINQLRIQLQKKSQRKDIFQLRNSVHKEISGKMSIKQTQRIVEKFENEVFEKFNENAQRLKKIESNWKKMINEQFLKIKQQLNENMKSKEYKAIAGKLQKKLKKCMQVNNQVIEDKEQKIRELNKQIKETKEQSYNQFQQICQLIETINSNMNNCSGVWIAQEQIIKNKSISWTKQYANTDKENYKFENKKTQILIVKPGFYKIECWVQGCDSAPTLMINSQNYEKLSSRSQNNRHRFSQIVSLTDNRSLLSLKLEAGNSYECALVRISKL